MDLLCEVDRVSNVVPLTEEHNVVRVCLYLQGLSNFAATPGDKVMYLKCCFDIYLRHKQYPHALRIALKLSDNKMVLQVFTSCEDRVMKKQCAYMVARSKFNHDFEE